MKNRPSDYKSPVDYLWDIVAPKKLDPETKKVLDWLNTPRKVEDDHRASLDRDSQIIEREQKYQHENNR